MNIVPSPVIWNHPQTICPDLRPYWILVQRQDKDGVILTTRDRTQQHLFSTQEGIALRYFVGVFTIEQVHQYCQKECGNLPDDFIPQLLSQLVNLRILALDLPENLAALQSTQNQPSDPKVGSEPRLKDNVELIHHEDGHWILRNPEHVTFLQLNDTAKQIVEQLGIVPIATLVQQYGVSSQEIRTLLKQLMVTGMLVGTEPPKPPKKKFNPMQLITFRMRLWNPDYFLNHIVHPLHWIWTKTFWLLLCVCLTLTGAIALHERAEILWTGQQFMSHLTFSTTLGFSFCSIMVVTLHELGHALTLKHYGGTVPEIGLMFMMMIPIAYTNTTDQYSLPKRSQRMFVVGAGVLCQLIIASFGFWLWKSSSSGSWIWTLSYLLFSASLFTVAINLNPLAKFDGYYLTVACTGINNLRQRAFQFYVNLLCCRPSHEQGRVRWILALYAPFSLLYTVTVFGFLFLHITDWTLTHIPFTALVLAGLWALYYYLAPDPN
jgi:putative peptide zinc metalloprotease protein